MHEDQGRSALILPVMEPFYRRFAQPLAHVVLRVLVGGMLVIEGWPKIQAPFAMAGFTESIGLSLPGWLWSAVLAVLQFAGGLMIMAGLLTRPVALANGLMLAVTYWFHATHPYGAAILSPEGMAGKFPVSRLLVSPGSSPAVRRPSPKRRALAVHPSSRAPLSPPVPSRPALTFALAPWTARSPRRGCSRPGPGCPATRSSPRRSRHAATTSTQGRPTGTRRSRRTSKSADKDPRV